MTNHDVMKSFCVGMRSDWESFKMHWLLS